jgi:excisionase family DNA binding protein
MSPMDTIWHDLDSAAEVTNLSRRTIQREIQKGRLASVRVGSRRLIPQKALIAWTQLVEAESERRAAS